MNDALFKIGLIMFMAIITGLDIYYCAKIGKICKKQIENLQAEINHLEEIDSAMSYEIRKQWFIDRIGKRVYRNDQGCECEVCKAIAKEGLIVEDRTHAVYLCDVEASSNGEGYPLRYFDTVKERDEYVKSLEKRRK